LIKEKRTICTEEAQYWYQTWLTASMLGDMFLIQFVEIFDIEEEFLRRGYSCH
jgi:hypothetical protein